MNNKPTDTLYRVRSTIDNWPHRGWRFNGVGVTWLRDAEEPPVPYEQAIQDYDPADRERFCYLEATVSDLFTREEAEQLQAWLLATFETESELEAVPLPLTQDSPHSPGILPLGGTRDLHSLSNYEDYSLPFKAKGFYDVEGYPALPESRQAIKLWFTLPGPDQPAKVEGLEGLDHDQRWLLAGALEQACHEADFAEWDQSPPAVRLSLSGQFFKLPCGLCGDPMETGGIEIVLAESNNTVCRTCAERFVPHVRALQAVCNKWEQYFWYDEPGDRTGERLVALLEQEGLYTLTPAELEAQITGIVREGGYTPEPYEPETIIPGEFYLCSDPASPAPTFEQVSPERWQELESSEGYVTQAGFEAPQLGIYCRLAYPGQPLDQQQEADLAGRLAVVWIQQRAEQAQKGKILPVDFGQGDELPF